MMSVHHKSIKRFYLDGDIYDEAAIGRLKTEYIRLLVSEMKIIGYVPKIDIDPDFTIRYNSEKQIFDFKLSVYGIYVGKKKAEWIAGIDGTTAITTVENKLKEYYQEQASM